MKSALCAGSDPEGRACSSHGKGPSSSKEALGGSGLSDAALAVLRVVLLEVTLRWLRSTFDICLLSPDQQALSDGLLTASVAQQTSHVTLGRRSNTIYAS